MEPVFFILKIFENFENTFHFFKINFFCKNYFFLYIVLLFSSLFLVWTANIYSKDRRLFVYFFFYLGRNIDEFSSILLLHLYCYSAQNLLPTCFLLYSPGSYCSPLSSPKEWDSKSCRQGGGVAHFHTFRYNHLESVQIV